MISRGLILLFQNLCQIIIFQITKYEARNSSGYLANFIWIRWYDSKGGKNIGQGCSEKSHFLKLHDEQTEKKN